MNDSGKGMVRLQSTQPKPDRLTQIGVGLALLALVAILVIAAFTYG